MTRVFELDKFAYNSVLLKEIKSLAVKHKQDQPKDGKIITIFKKTIKYLLFALFASQVIYSVISKNRKWTFPIIFDKRQMDLLAFQLFHNNIFVCLLPE